MEPELLVRLVSDRELGLGLVDRLGMELAGDMWVVHKILPVLVDCKLELELDCPY